MILCIFLHILSLCQPPLSEAQDYHAFHISKTDITFQPKEKSVQITMHIFIDDLEAALALMGHKSLFVGTEREKQEANDLIYNYLQRNFFIKINNKNAPFVWVGKETTPDKQALWVYLEIKNIKDIKQIFVDNRILTEVYDDQKNIVQVNVPNKKQGYFLLDKRKTTEGGVF